MNPRIAILSFIVCAVYVSGTPVLHAAPISGNLAPPKKSASQPATDTMQQTFKVTSPKDPVLIRFGATSPGPVYVDLTWQGPPLTIALQHDASRQVVASVPSKPQSARLTYSIQPADVQKGYFWTVSVSAPAPVSGTIRIISPKADPVKMAQASKAAVRPAGAPSSVPLQSPKTRADAIPAARTLPVRGFQTWDALWKDVWDTSNRTYRIAVADTVRQTPGCTGNLELDSTVEQTIRAIRDRKFGDAVRSLAKFQDRSLCLTVEGVRGLDFALSYYTERALRELPPDQQRIAIQGTMNLGMLSFDQISYTGSSWWGGVVGFKYYPQVIAQLNGYPFQELGVWSFNFEKGLLQQSVSQQALLDKLAYLANPVNGKHSSGGGGGSSGSAGSGGSGIAGNTGGASCMIAALGGAGGRGMFSCMQKATSGIRPSAATILAGPVDPSATVRDPRCTMSESGGETDSGGKKNPPPVDNRAWWEKAWDCIKNWSCDPPPPPEKPSQCEGCKPLERKLPKIPEGDPGYRTAPGDPGAGGAGGGCGNASNAARRMQAMYDCTKGGGGSAFAGGRKPGTPGGMNPGVVNPNPNSDPQLGGQAAGMMACLTQAGSMVRSGPNDPKCAATKCAPGQPCPCEQGGLKSQGEYQLRVPTKTGAPNCPNPPCGQPMGGGGVPGSGNPPPGGPRPRPF